MSEEREAVVTASTSVAAVCEASTRYAIDGLMVAESGVAAATDGRCLTLTEIDVEGEIGQDANDVRDLKERNGWQLIPGKLVRRPTANIPTKLILNGRVECVNNSKIGDYVQGRYPVLGTCVPSVSAECIGIKLDAKLLAKVAEAICLPGESGVVLLIDPKDMEKAICVRPTPRSGGLTSVNLGVLMPLTYERDVKRSTADEICGYNNARDRLVHDLPVEFRGKK